MSSDERTPSTRSPAPNLPGREPAARVEGLIRQLWSASAEASSLALDQLVALGRAAVSELTTAFRDETKDSRRATLARLLGRIGPDAAVAVPLLLEALKSERGHVRHAAVEALAVMGDAATLAVPTLIALLDDWHPETRVHAAIALARFARDAQGAILPLVRMLADREEKVREPAFETLVRVGRSVVPLLAKLVRCTDYGELRLLLAWKADWTDWCNRSWAPVDQVDREPDKAQRNVAWGVHSIVEEHQRLEILRDMAAKVLGSIGAEAAEAVPAFVEALSDPSGRIRERVAQGLGRIGFAARPALQALTLALGDASEAVRKAAAESLPMIAVDWAADPQISDALETIVDKLQLNGAAQEIAGKALTRIGAAGVPALVKALATGGRVQREAVVKTLGTVGSQVPAAVSALVHALDDAHQWVRDAAAESLKKIGATVETIACPNCQSMSKVPGGGRGDRVTHCPKCRHSWERVPS